MKYLSLIYLEEKKLEDLPNSERDALVHASLAYGDELRTSGHSVVSGALQSTQTAATVRVRNNKVIITDGPFAETKEQLIGFVLVEAKDLNEAIQVAAKSPMAKLGSIEVRPLRELKRPSHP